MAEAVQLSDAEARRRATREFDVNFVVLAGAGTGKTSLLVERLLNALGQGVARLDEIAAITFTEKAAGELRERLASGLERLRALALGEVEPGTHEADRSHAYLTGALALEAPGIAERALEALETLDVARVTTIHGLCSELLREHPLEADIEPDFAVDSGGQSDAVAPEEWEAFIQEELGPETRRAELWDRLLARLPLKAVHQAAVLMADPRIPETLLRDPGASTAAERLFREEAAALGQRVARLLADAAGLTDHGHASFVAMQGALDALANEGLAAFSRWCEAHVARVEKLARSRPRPNKDLTGVDARTFQAISADASRFIGDLQGVNDETAPLLVEAVAPFATRMREALLSRGFVGFDALLVLARDLLRDHPEVRRELKRRYRMLLVDEFQDTDPIQYELVLFLAEREEEAAADAFAANLAPGRLFAVGDAKQSIYRFRGADYAAYGTAVERIVASGGEKLELTSNFRSVAGVLTPVNRLFGARGGCWWESPHQPPYVPIDPIRESDDDEPRVELWTIEVPEPVHAGDRRQAEGRVIAAEIERAVTEDRIGYAGVTLLLRAFTNVTTYLRALRERGIPFVVDGGREFLERPEIKQLMALLRTLSRPADPTALLAFLRSPAGGVMDTELADYAADRRPWSWSARPDAGRFPRISDRFAALRELAEQTRQVPADEVVRRVIRGMQLLPLGAAAYEGAQRVANLTKLSAAAGELARDGRLSLDEVIDALEQGRLADLHTDRPLADEKAEAVRITSIHRMKGLENEWVILADLARERMPFFRRREEIAEARLPGAASALAVRAAGRSNTVDAWRSRENRRHEEAEEVRVLYVALTRARERLILIAGPSRGKAPWLEALGPWNYAPAALPDDGAPLVDGTVLHRRMQARRVSPVAPEFDDALGQRARARYEEAARVARTRSHDGFVRPSGLEDTRPPAGATMATEDRERARLVGAIVHRWLERWELDPVADLGTELSPLARTALAAAHLPMTEVETIVEPARAILLTFLDSPLAARLRECDRVGREVPLLLQTEAGNARGTIDLLYRDRGGELVVADYKTDRETEPTALAARYGPQLGVYTEAVRTAFGLLFEPRAELWMLRSGTIVPL